MVRVSIIWLVLYGTSKKLNKSRKVQVKINGTKISEAESYKYLVAEMDKSLNNKHIDSTVRKASAKVKLLSRIRQSINPYVAEIIYKVMIESTLSYCNNLFLGISNAAVSRLANKLKIVLLKLYIAKMLF